MRLKIVLKKIGISLMLLFALYMAGHEIFSILIPRSFEVSGQVLGFDLAAVGIAALFLWAAKVCWQALRAKPSDVKSAAEPNPQHLA